MQQEAAAIPQLSCYIFKVICCMKRSSNSRIAVARSLAEACDIIDLSSRKNTHTQSTAHS